jgi:hypothetical protein
MRSDTMVALFALLTVIGLGIGMVWASFEAFRRPRDNND